MTFCIRYVTVFSSFVLLYLIQGQAESKQQNSTSHQPPESLQRQSPYIMKSKWVSIAGCGYWSFNIYDTLSSTQEIFRHYFKGNFSREEDRFQCSLKCSSKLGIIYFVFHKTVCMCISNEEKLLVEKANLDCLKMCNTTEHYCYSGDGLPVFVFKNSTKEKQIPTKLISYLDQRCLKEENGIYKSLEKRICLAPLSKEDCSYLNVVFSHGVPSSNLFVQWICERSNDTFTKYFRTIHKSTGYASSTENASTTVQMITISESFFDQEHGRASRSLNATNVRTCHSTSYCNFLDWSDVNISFVIAAVVIAVLVIIVIALSRINCQLRKKSKEALYTNFTVDRVQYSHSTIPRFQQSTRSYMEILPMSPIVHSENEQSIVQDITQPGNTETGGYITPIAGDESEGTGHYQFVPRFLSKNEHSVVQDITQQENAETEGYITPIAGDESERTGHYQFVP